nr:phosphatase PAP2 family protein [uncultured Anaeromusa sp.]
MQYDLELLFFINGLAGHVRWLDAVVAAFSTYGPLLFGAYLLALWFSGKTLAEKRENRKQVLYGFASLFLALGVNHVLGLLWFRSRPYVDHAVQRLVSVTSEASFPSNHAAGSMSIAASLWCGFSRKGKVFLVLAVLMALSRVYAGVHYPSDVLGGMAIGFLSSFLVHKNRRYIEKPVGIILALTEELERKFDYGKAVAHK